MADITNTRSVNTRRFAVQVDDGAVHLIQLGDLSSTVRDFEDGLELKRRASTLPIGDTTTAIFRSGSVTITRQSDPDLRELRRIRTTGSCGCCGAKQSDSCAIFIANVRDSDRTYYARLCEYCFTDFEDHGDFDRPDPALAIATLMLGTDEDGIAAVLEDLGADDIPAIPLPTPRALSVPVDRPESGCQQ